MPPNPRDNLAGGEVPRERVEVVVAEALRGTGMGILTRTTQARAVVDRLLYFRLLSQDVEGMRNQHGYAPLHAAGWLAPHRVDRLKEYAEALRDAGALTEAGIITAILNGEDPEYG